MAGLPNQKRRAGVGAASAPLIPDRGTLKLLTSFTGIRHRGLRRCLIDLVDAISKTTPKKEEERP
jgi:hypothetical protein